MGADSSLRLGRMTYIAAGAAYIGLIGFLGIYLSNPLAILGFGILMIDLIMIDDSKWEGKLEL